jgi:hypothetical protein
MSKTRDNSRAVVAFVVRKREIDAILARLVHRSTEHFNLEAWCDHLGQCRHGGQQPGRAAPGQ